MPAVLYGPGDINAHSVNEFVPLDEVITCTKVLSTSLSRWMK
jgi:acetylornithine deacetylase/succinyl-diaminopimelate desuccinylase-like protein